MGDVILTMKDIDKSFPGVHALDHVNFEVRRGEVHALMGENGAGKSTLMKVLTGIYQKDSGSITYKGQEVAFHNTREAQDAGVVIVHQELNMVGGLASIGGTVIGVFIISLLQQGIMAFGLGKGQQMIITGIIVIVAVYADVSARRRKN